MNAVERAVALLAVVLVVVLGLAAALPAVAAPGPRERVVVALRTPGPGVPSIAYRLAQAYGGAVRASWDGAGAFSADLPPSAIEALRRHPYVRAVEPNHVFSIASTDVPSGIARVDGVRGTGVTRGGRVDVDVAVIDSGVDGTHPDLDVVAAVDCYDGTCSEERVAVDVLGHGTHVAGTIGAFDDAAGVVGIAPGARLWSVRVLDADGNGTLEGVVAALDWIRGRGGVIEVANASFGCECASEVLDTAVERLVSDGTVLVVAAGNRSTDASRIAPAADPDVISVSAFADLDGAPGGKAAGPLCATLPDLDDAFASFSNFGSVVDLAAPGVCILSTVPVEAGSYGVSSGTSMAAPHVAGAAARYLVERGVPRDGDRARTVREGLLAEWSVPQSGACGFTGGRSDEPVLHLTRCGRPIAATAAAADAPGAPSCRTSLQPPRPGTAARGRAHRTAIDCIVEHRFAR